MLPDLNEHMPTTKSGATSAERGTPLRRSDKGEAMRTRAFRLACAMLVVATMAWAHHFGAGVDAPERSP